MTQHQTKGGIWDYKLYNLPLPYFLLVAAVVFAATFLGVLPQGMAGSFALMIVLGAILQEIGDRDPIVRSYWRRCHRDLASACWPTTASSRRWCRTSTSSSPPAPSWNFSDHRLRANRSCCHGGALLRPYSVAFRLAFALAIGAITATACQSCCHRATIIGGGTGRGAAPFPRYSSPAADDGGGGDLHHDARGRHRQRPVRASGVVVKATAQGPQRPGAPDLPGRRPQGDGDLDETAARDKINIGYPVSPAGQMFFRLRPHRGAG